MTSTSASQTVASPAVIDRLFLHDLPLVEGVYLARDHGGSENDRQTNQAFSEKWTKLDQHADDDEEGWKQFQFDWYLRCYGYANEAELAAHLAGCGLILDAGCGPGYKAAWFARLNPMATVVAMDLSESVGLAAQRYRDVPNLVFVRGDIADTPFRDGSFDLISCDQVLHHTDSPPATLREFRRLLRPGGSLNTYVYATKALPRELLDEHLREFSKTLDKEQLWELSSQLTELGRNLAELKIEIDVPAIPLFGIAGGRQDLQRFIYWNFVKCFWNDGHGFDASRMINFDWYAPSNAARYSREDFTQMVRGAGFTERFLHSEEACHTGRFE